MDARPNYERAHFRCFPCGIVVRGLKRFVRHCTNVIHVAPYRCAYCNAGSTQHLRSLVRHLKNHHPNGENGLDGAGNVDDVDMNVDQNAEVNLENENDDLVDGGQHDDAEVSDHDANEEEGVELPGPDAIQDLCQAAARCTLNLRQASGVTTSAVQRFQVECNQMIRTVTDNNLIRVREFLTAEGIDSPASRALLQELQLEDPFRHVRSLKQQLNYFAREFGMVKPKTCFIGYRQDYFLNPATGQYEPVQVPMSFEYISIIETITSALSNPKIRNLIESETPSADGTIRSYLDGTRSQSRVLLTRYPKIIRLQLYWDDLEVVNALGSKTTIHKLAGFYVSIQNLPAIENSQLSSILLLALAHSEDLKVDNGFDSVLAPFLGELRKLESDRGVNIIVDGQPFVLRATLTTLVPGVSVASVS
ncbi:uncharacterized protein LOC117649911 [Thrips palmi]|uniref:Uncharacterized protein LOC117649911 n=1 Tax=Thrips palmi TaxID=161013 RepID=A0A6P8ZUL1_THRPL|nr:uncharacterized protein LOC117649911 [Thrips palmi]